MPIITVDDGVQIHYESRGEGDPLLMIQGYGPPGSLFEQSIPSYKGFQCVYFDNRGSGTSTSGDEPVSIERFADDAAAVMDAVGWESANVVGFSMGGMIVMELALRHPGRVRSMVLGSTTCNTPKANPEEVRQIYAYAGLSRMMAEDPDNAAPAAMQWWYGDHLDEAGGTREIAIELMKATPMGRPLTDEEIIATMGAWSCGERLGQLSDVPALVVHGNEDAIFPLHCAYDTFEHLPLAELRVYSPAPHAFRAFVGANTETDLAAWFRARADEFQG